MILYHGTTVRRARRICLEGFQPRRPSRRVWFAKSRAYAEGRARTQARRAHDRPAVLTCDLDVAQLRRRLGKRRFFQQGGNIAIDGPVPAKAVRSAPAVEVPVTRQELAEWVNRLLGLKPHKGVGRTHPGIDRMARWIRNRLRTHPKATVSPGEVLHIARQWLAEFFEGVEIDPERLRPSRRPATVEVRAEIEAPPPPDPREERALERLQAEKPAQRARGLRLLADLDEPDIFDWCVMFLEDESVEVRLAALETMLRCEDGHVEPLAPLAASDQKRVRAAAIAALARHAGPEAPRWFERGLKDPEACVRLATAGQLDHLDPVKHRRLFELALYDPNRHVAERARTLVAHKGYGELKW